MLCSASFVRCARWRWWLAIVLATCGFSTFFHRGSEAAEEPGALRIHTHQSYVEEVQRPADFDIKDMKAAFARVLGGLPDRVKVYPTEDYFYFKFHHAGVPYAGNIRLQNELRDQGKVHFAYAAELFDRAEEPQLFHALFDRAQGVEVERLDRFTYRVAFGGKSVVFELNDLSAVVPPAGMLGSDERYIGPVFDESAVRFFLVYNRRLKLFQYLLDETVPMTEVLAASRISGNILIGGCTGFAYYRDRKRERKILIGVLERNARANNYFDGPFDQLPDNFIEGEALRSAILEVEPGLAGRIDRFGSSFDGRQRHMIAPYLHYTGEGELRIFERCATNRRIRLDLYDACFAVDEALSPRRVLTVAEHRQRQQANQPSFPRSRKR